MDAGAIRPVKQRCCVVSRAVINDNHLNLSRPLSQSAFNSLANQMSAIVGWDYYRQEWARHKQLLLHIKIGGRPPMSDQAHLRPKHEQTISGNRSRGTRLLPLQKSPSE